MSDQPVWSSSTTNRKRIVKKPNIPVGHEAFLKAIETAGSILTIEKTNGVVLKGTVKTSDKYTISLKVTRDDGSYQTYVINKSAIDSFWTDPEDNRKQG